MSIFNVLRKFSRIFSSKQKKKILIIAFMMIIGGFLEMCSVSLIIPFMNAVMDPDSLMDKWYIQSIKNVLVIDSSRGILVFISLVLAMLYIIKNVYLIVQFNVQYKFVYGYMLDTQKRMLTSYLDRPYEFYLSVDSGEVIRIMNTDIPNAFNMLNMVLSFLTEMIVSGMLVLTVFVISPFITVCMAVVLLFLIFIINRFLKPILRKAGESNQYSYAKMNKWLMQSIQGIKEIKVTNHEQYFHDQYTSNGEVHINSQRRYQVMSTIPRFSIEAVSMTTMFVVIAVLIYGGIELNSIVPTLSAVAVAAIRLLPSTNRMTSALSNVAFYEPALDKVIENMTDIEKNYHDVGTVNDKSFNRIKKLDDEIKLNNITYRYPDSDSDVLKGADMCVKRGESVGIVGSSGAGKSTVVNIVLGLLKADQGDVLVDNRSVDEDISGWHNLIGYIPQSIFLMDDTIRANVAFGIDQDLVSDDRVWDVLQESSLKEFVSNLPKGLDTVIGEQGVRLSGGQRQRIGIARALYLNPEVLIFDEATSALDNETEAAIMESVNGLHGQKTMIIIAHRLSTIEKCDHIYRVENGIISKER